MLRYILLFQLVLIPTLPAQDKPRPPVRAAVIGGMTLSGMWQALSETFEKDTGWKVQTVVTGPKDVLKAVAQVGEADIVTLHSSDKATDLVAHGWMRNLRPWARNEHCILGPEADPAGIRGMTSGAAALTAIAKAQAPFVDFSGPGSSEVAHKLWQKAGIRPSGDWMIQDATVTPQEIGEFAANRGAYVVVGRIPILKGKIPAPGMQILVEGDPEMRRPYVVMEVNPEKFPNANAEGARALTDWMAGEPGQRFLIEYGKTVADGPEFFPANPDAAP